MVDPDRFSDFIKFDYTHTQEAIEKFDDLRARLKGWMLTVTAGLSAVAITERHWQLLLIAIAAILTFALAELAYIHIQEAAVARSKQLEVLLNSFLHDGLGPDHESYVFGINAVFFSGSRRIRLTQMRSWIMYRTFNPYLYGGLLIALVLGLAVGFADNWFE